MRQHRHPQRRKLKHLESLEPIFAQLQHLVHIREEPDARLRLVMIGKAMNKSQRSILNLNLVR